MDFEFTEEQKALVALAKDFCKREVTPEYMSKLSERKSEERVPWDLIKKMRDLGLTTLTIPEKYGGGGGADLLTLAVLAETFGQHCGVVGLLPTMYWKMFTEVATFGSEEQQEEIFTRAMNDYTFAIGEIATEANHGFDPVLPYDEPGSGLKTFAYKDGDEYVINGEKCFCGFLQAKMLFVYVRTDKNKPLSQSMSILLVPTDTPGFSIVRFNKFMHTVSDLNGDLLFDNVRVPTRYLIGEENKGFAIFEGRRGVWVPYVAFKIGQAQAIYEFTKEYAKTRIQGGKPIFEHLTVGTRVVDMLLHIEQARYLVYKTAWEYDQAIKAGSKVVSSLGFNLCVAAWHNLDVLLAGHAAEVFGGRAALKELPIEGYIRTVYGLHHGFGTSNLNLIKSMSMI
jgi:alkylation response protein AidB-like acyl-CoA dehydrogenase